MGEEEEEELSRLVGCFLIADRWKTLGAASAKVALSRNVPLGHQTNDMLVHTITYPLEAPTFSP